jgi:hypothetical protein
MDLESFTGNYLETGNSVLYVIYMVPHNHVLCTCDQVLCLGSLY